MRKADFQAATSKAKEVLKDFFQKHPSTPLPIPLEKIVKMHGLKLVYSDFSHAPSVSGALKRETKTIFINNEDTVERQLFTAAHELGHYLLHKSVKNDILYRKNIDTPETDYKEQEANAFAAELLMPADKVIRTWDVFHDEDVMSTVFLVSRSAMNYRLKFLGLIPR